MALLLVGSLIILSSYGQIPNNTLFTTAPCGVYSDYQTFTVDNSSGQHTTFKVTAYPKSCIDDNHGAVGILPWIWGCDPTNTDQWFNLIPSNTANNVIFQAFGSANTCLQSSSPDSFSSITMQKCNKSHTLQQWNIASNGSIITGSNLLLCLTVNVASIYPFIWPLPQQYILSNQLAVNIDASQFQFTQNTDSNIINTAFKRYIKLCFPHKPEGKGDSTMNTIKQLKVSIKDGSEDTLAYNMDESYNISITLLGTAILNANTIWGALRGLETFSQMIIFNFSLRYYQTYTAS
eukprot:354882_1